MSTITEAEEHLNRERLLMVAEKARLKRKHMRRLKRTLAKYSKPRVDTYDAGTLRYGEPIARMPVP
jgi:hypothetical protein